MTGVLGVARFVFPQLLAQLAKAVEADGADVVAARLMADCAPSLGRADLHALAQVLPALAEQSRAHLASRLAQGDT